KIIFRPIDHDEAKRELESLEALKDLRHAFLLQVHAFWQFEDRLTIVMELADGSIRGLLKDCKQLGQNGIPLPQLLGYFHDAAEALDYLHRCRVLHRDVKPDNIMIFNTHAKVGDSALARVY